MTVPYDKHYESRDLFGEPYPELLAYFERQARKGKVLDLGCGQGRDAVPLARMGFQVTGVDHSKIGVEQMNQVSDDEELGIRSLVSDIYAFTDFAGYKFVLLDSIFHFNKKDADKELQFLDRIVKGIDPCSKVILCMANTGGKVKIAKTLFAKSSEVKLEEEIYYTYNFVDGDSGHSSKTAYCMLVCRRI